MVTVHAIRKKDADGKLSKPIEYEEAKDLLKQMRWENRISTGYEALDEVLGGLVRGNVTLIAGRPAMGRSSFALNMVSRISRQLSGTILVISPRFRADELTFRLLKIGTNLRADSFLDGSLPPETLSEKCAECFHGRKSSIRFDTTTYLTLENIWWHCNSIPDLRLVVIDNPEQIYTLNENCWIDDRWRPTPMPIDHVLTSLQALALELYVPIVCTAYLKRSLEHRKNKRPKLTDLKKLHILPDDLEQIIFLYRDRYYDYVSDEKAELIVAKNDYGKTGTVELAWDYATCRFEEIQKAT